MTASRSVLVPCVLSAALLVVALAVRGTGWDGDSLVSIAQFQKLVHPHLFETPDSGTSPKLLPIAAFGAFHAATGSYAIHWVTIALMAFAIAKLVRLPAEYGGGPLWLVLPFLCPLVINTVLSADNPALAAGFLILGLVSLFEGRLNLALMHFLLSEFSRPGAYAIIAVLILLKWVPAFAVPLRRLNLFVAVPVLVLALAHSALSYRLVYRTFDGFLAASMFYPGLLDDPLRFRHDPWVVMEFLRHVRHSLRHLMPVWLLVLGAIGWIVCLRTRPVWNNTLWGLFFVPLTILPLTAFLLGPYFPNQAYMIFLAFPVLAGVAMLWDRFWPLRSEVATLMLCAAMALGLAVFDGWRLRGRFEVNPPASVWWTSDPQTRRLVEQARERAGRPLVLLTSCDVITLTIDVAGAISRLVVFSNEAAGDGVRRYLRDCNQLYFRKRARDLLLPAEADALQSTAPDVIYTTGSGLELLRDMSLESFERHELRAGRMLLIRTDAEAHAAGLPSTFLK